ncbi:MAG: transposase [Salinibacter sp.]|uniref:transposase n=1 Tax=Salinibacter sp. TaxID=2065818 RepID=UPI002FC2E570
MVHGNHGPSGREFSRQTVSDLTKRLDVQIRAWLSMAWAERPLKGNYPFVMADAIRIKVHRQEAVQST